MALIPKSSTRITPQQQAVFKVFQDGSGHYSAEQVYAIVVKVLPRVSLATVYRNLDKLSDLSLVTKTSIQGINYFELHKSPHYHAICLSCGAIEDIDGGPASDIEEFFARSTSYALTGHELVLYGVCPTCQQVRRASRGRKRVQ